MRYEGWKLVGAAVFLLVGTTSMWAKSRSIEDYPLRVQILDVQWDRNFGGMSGTGHGNLQTPSGESNGFSFTSSCMHHFMENIGNSAYPGRWKKERAVLELRGTEIGNEKKHDDCEVKVSLSDSVYEKRNGQLVTITQAEWQAAKQKQREAKEAESADLDPTHYPLRFKLLQADWTPANPGFNGSGRGNLRYEDKTVRAVEFSVHGPIHLSDSLANDAYAARLNATSDRLYLLVHLVGEHGQNSFRQCELKIDLKPYVFVKNAGQLSTMSQEEYKRMVQEREAKRLSVASNTPTNPQ